MNFKESKAIYLQIADRICDEVLLGQYREEERIPSVREYAWRNGHTPSAESSSPSGFRLIDIRYHASVLRRLLTRRQSTAYSHCKCPLTDPLYQTVGLFQPS